MAGGTYISHEDVEKWLGETLDGSSVPTDSHVDNLSVFAEGLAATWSYPTSLSTLNGRDSGALTTILVEIVINMLRDWDVWKKGGGTTAGEGFTYRAPRGYEDLKQALLNMCRGDFANIKMID